MVHSSMKNLQFDRRLFGRRGWVDAADTEKHLAELPDAAEKGETIGEDESGSGAARAQTAAPSEAPAPTSDSGFLPES